MGDGFDQIGKTNMMRINVDKRKQFDQVKKEKDKIERDRRISTTEEEIKQTQREYKMDDCTHVVQNIVYARDYKIFDTKNNLVIQREAFLHENFLDIK